MTAVSSRFVQVDGARTHYLEAGNGPHLVLLHSGEFGACAELSWDHNIEALAEDFHVVAPDWLGFGETDKLFDFGDAFGRRIGHMTAFLRTLCIERAHFMGNSMAGGMLAWVASRERPPWPLDRIVLVSGGGFAPDNDARKVLNTYDGTRDHMVRMLQVLLYSPRFWEDEAYVERRWRLSLVPGSWECTAAARFRLPGVERPHRDRHAETHYGDIRVPTLIVAGEDDLLRMPGYAVELQKEIPGSRLQVYPQARHCPHIDQAAAFNRLARDFLKGM